MTVHIVASIVIGATVLGYIHHKYTSSGAGASRDSEQGPRRSLPESVGKFPEGSKEAQFQKSGFWESGSLWKVRDAQQAFRRWGKPK